MTAERKTSSLSKSQLTALPHVPKQQLREGTQPRASFLALGGFDLMGFFKRTFWSQEVESVFGETERKELQNMGAS